MRARWRSERIGISEYREVVCAVSCGTCVRRIGFKRLKNDLPPSDGEHNLPDMLRACRRCVKRRGIIARGSEVARRQPHKRVAQKSLGTLHASRSSSTRRPRSRLLGACRSPNV